MIVRNQSEETSATSRIHLRAVCMCLLGSGLRLHLYSLTAKGQQQSRELIFKGGFHRRVGVTFAARKGSEKEKARRSLSSPAMCLDRADSAKALFPPLPPPQCSWSGGSGESRGTVSFLDRNQFPRKMPSKKISSLKNIFTFNRHTWVARKPSGRQQQ